MEQGPRVGSGGWGAGAGHDFHQNAREGGTNIGRDQINYFVQEQQRRGLTALHQLPRALGDFTGRGSELVDLERTMSVQAHNGVAAVTLIYGMAGVGKSVLALQLAHRLRPRFPDAQLLVRLGGVGIPEISAEAAVDRLLGAFGVDAEHLPPDPEARLGLYRSLLEDRRALVLLDNATRAEQVEPLLPANPTCAALITSRWQLPELEGISRYPLLAFAEREALELLERIVGIERISADPEAARRVIELCGELPLAVRIAGTSLTMPATMRQPLSRLVEKLEDESSRLDQLTQRDRAVRASFEVSYQALSADAKRLFRLLGLLAVPDFSSDMVSVLAGADPEDVIRWLEELANAQLLQLTGSIGERYRFHDLIRLFAKERATVEESSEIREQAFLRAFEWYLAATMSARRHLWPDDTGSIEDARDTFVSYEAALAWLETERPSLIAMVKQASTQGHELLAFYLAYALFRYFEVRRYWSDCQVVGKAALDAVRRIGNREFEASALNDLASASHAQGRFEESIAYAKQAVEISRELGKRYAEGTFLVSLALSYRDSGQMDEAVASLEESLTIMREFKDRAREGAVLSNLGAAFYMAGRTDEAIRILNDGLSIAEELNSQYDQVIILGNLGLSYDAQGRLEKAIAVTEQSVVILRQLGDNEEEARMLVRLNGYYARRGRVAEADVGHQINPYHDPKPE